MDRIAHGYGTAPSCAVLAYGTVIRLDASRLGPWYSLSLVVGLAIGSGIFRTPVSVAARVPDAPTLLGLWLTGGIITLCGAPSVAELSAALPHTGGSCVYLREGWGRPVAFLFGWAQLVLLRASAVGGIAMRPSLPRPYRAPGYPLTPAVIIAASAFLVGNAIWADPVWTGVSFGLVLTGLPVYVALFRQGPAA